MKFDLHVTYEKIYIIFLRNEKFKEIWYETFSYNIKEVSMLLLFLLRQWRESHRLP